MATMASPLIAGKRVPQGHTAINCGIRLAGDGRGAVPLSQIRDTEFQGNKKNP
jgi:hypothetical protein